MKTEPIKMEFFTLPARHYFKMIRPIPRSKKKRIRNKWKNMVRFVFVKIS